MKKFYYVISIILALGITSYYVKKNRHAPVLINANYEADPVSFLQNYVRINTSFPHLEYDQAIEFFKQQASTDGFEYHVELLPSGYPVMMITYQGTDSALPALVLNHHMDVVPAANKSLWSVDPFAASIVDSKIIGRGTQDMKGVGVVHYCALRKLKQAGIQPKRTIHVLLVPDEERGGFLGTGQFIETDYFKQLNIGYVLDEGIPSGMDDGFYLKVDERKPIQICIKGKGEMAHGSHLMCDNALHTLVQFLHRLTQEHKKQQDRGESEASRGKCTSFNITSLTAGVINNGVVALNTVPAEAQATVDIRVGSMTKMSDIIQMLDDVIKEYPSLSYAIEATVPDREPSTALDSDLYATLTQVLHEANMKTIPLYAQESSDLRFYWGQGIQGVGFTPFTSKNNIHGINEYITLAEFEGALDIFVSILEKFCAQ